MSPFSRWLRSLRLRWIRFRHSLSGYVKIRLEYPREEQADNPAEVVWSKHLGNGLYQLENIPFTEAFNLHDVVRCEERPDELPTVVEVVRRSGNRTLRVAFQKEVPAETAVQIVSELMKRKVFFEKAGERHFMFNIEPDTDYETMKDYLRSKEAEGLLWFYE